MELQNETIYVSNLNDRLSVSDLKTLIYEFFSSFGQVVSVQVLRGKVNSSGRPIRGTAFVTFRSMAQASIALRNSKGFVLCGKEIRSQYAKTRSDEIAKLEGSYRPRFKPVRRKVVRSEPIQE